MQTLSVQEKSDLSVKRVQMLMLVTHVPARKLAPLPMFHPCCKCRERDVALGATLSAGCELPYSGCNSAWSCGRKQVFLKTLLLASSGHNA